MNKYESQLKSVMNKFQTSMTIMAWDIAEAIFKAHQQNLSNTLVELGAKANRKRNNVKALAKLKKKSPAALKKLALAASGKGTWNRGAGSYKLLGPGIEPTTYEMQRVTTGKKINVGLTALTSRWKHIP